MRHYDAIAAANSNKQHSPPPPHMQLRNTLSRQQSNSFLNSQQMSQPPLPQQHQSPYSQPKAMYSTNGFNTVSMLPRHASASGHGRKSVVSGLAGGSRLRSLSMAIGLTGFGDKKESVIIELFTFDVIVTMVFFFCCFSCFYVFTRGYRKRQIEKNMFF
jgi:hypothetical protein